MDINYIMEGKKTKKTKAKASILDLAFGKKTNKKSPKLDDSLFSLMGTKSKKGGLSSLMIKPQKGGLKGLMASPSTILGDRVTKPQKRAMKIAPFSDWDKDGVINALDCAPNNFFLHAKKSKRLRELKKEKKELGMVNKVKSDKPLGTSSITAQEYKARGMFFVPGVGFLKQDQPTLPIRKRHYLELEKEFDEGKITEQEFDEAMMKANPDLAERFTEGKMTRAEFIVEARKGYHFRSDPKIHNISKAALEQKAAEELSDEESGLPYKRHGMGWVKPGDVVQKRKPKKDPTMPSMKTLTGLSDEELEDLPFKEPTTRADRLQGERETAKLIRLKSREAEAEGRITKEQAKLVRDKSPDVGRELHTRMTKKPEPEEEEPEDKDEE